MFLNKDSSNILFWKVQGLDIGFYCTYSLEILYFDIPLNWNGQTNA